MLKKRRKLSMLIAVSSNAVEEKEEEAEDLTVERDDERMELGFVGLKEKKLLVLKLVSLGSEGSETEQ